MRIKCYGGPYDGKWVNSSLGQKWPVVLFYEYGNPDILVGFYKIWNQYRPEYHYLDHTEEWHISGLKI